MQKSCYYPSRKMALLIGNGIYNTEKTGLPCLSQPSNDIKAIRSMLVDKWEFDLKEDIRTITNQSVMVVQNSFEQILRVAKEAIKNKIMVFIFIYYTGHGAITSNRTVGLSDYDE